MLKYPFRHENIEVIMRSGMPLLVAENTFAAICDHLWNRAVIFLRNGSNICQMSQAIIVVGIPCSTLTMPLL
jgi:hypothetical protein